MTHWSKFRRAHKHLHEIEGLVERFLDMRPHRLIAEYKPQAPFNAGDEVEFTLTLHAPASPPEQLTWLIGDCLTNLRASLDHLVYGVALKHTGRAEIADQVRLAFPIYENAGKFDGWEGVMRKSNLLPDDVLTFIRENQPYVGHDGNKMTAERYLTRQPLWVLNALVNADKHRTFNTVSAARVTDVGLRIEGGHWAHALPDSISTSRTVEHGENVIWIPFVVDVPATAKVNVDLKFAPEVAFGQEWPARGRTVRGTLQVIRDHIRDVIFPALEPYV